MSASKPCYLLIDKIKIENANAISSPITYGFPAITGFLGAIHALNRQLSTEWQISLDGVLVACHRCDVQRYRPHSYNDYSFNLRRHPLKKDGNTASIIEEGKVHLTVSLLVELKASDDGRTWLDDNRKTFTKYVYKTLMRQPMAGGSVREIARVHLFGWNASEQNILAFLMPAFILMEARDTLVDILDELKKKDTDATALDVLLETATLHHIPEKKSGKNNEQNKENNPEKTGKKTTWTTESVKQGRGWLVPIPVGYQGIAPSFEAGKVKNCYASNYPVRYVECLYSLGKWVFPRHIEKLSTALWRYQDSDPFYFATQSINNAI